MKFGARSLDQRRCLRDTSSGRRRRRRLARRSTRRVARRRQVGDGQAGSPRSPLRSAESLAPTPTGLCGARRGECRAGNYRTRLNWSIRLAVCSAIQAAPRTDRLATPTASKTGLRDIQVSEPWKRAFWRTLADPGGIAGRRLGTAADLQEGPEITIRALHRDDDVEIDGAPETRAVKPVAQASVGIRVLQTAPRAWILT